MKVFRNWVSGVALAALLALGALAPGSRAHTSAGGRFNLPFDAQWGKAVLPTGVYTFSVDHLSLDSTISVMRGSQTVAVLRAQQFDDHDNQAKNPELVAIRHDGKVTIRALRLPNAGTFYFALPKDLKALASREPQLLETVTVEVRGE